MNGPLGELYFERCAYYHNSETIDNIIYVHLNSTVINIHAQLKFNIGA